MVAAVFASVVLLLVLLVVDVDVEDILLVVVFAGSFALVVDLVNHGKKGVVVVK